MMKDVELNVPFLILRPMKKVVLDCPSSDKLDEVSDSILKTGLFNGVVAFSGAMGAGKTTLIKSLCKKMGVLGHVSSPTFSLVNEYESESGETIFHFDFYRIKSIDEALDMGIEDYLLSGNLCLIEWPEKIDSLLDNDYTHISIEVNNGSRIITVE